jgi:opacity protein-like surface antigen
MGDSDTGIAWQGIAGLRYGINENIDVSLKYRFFTSAKERARLHGRSGRVPVQRQRQDSHA